MKLPVPEKILEQHLVALGKTGAGKSSALRVLVEHLLRHKKRVCVLDPKGDWWGLKYSADGKSEGFPVIAFGDFKEPKATDIPINDHSGKHVAELVAGGNRPCIIGFRGWMTAHMVRFWIDFASTLFANNAGELYLVGDEFHNFAPKGQVKGLEGDMAKCLHWSNRLLSEGRGLGIVCLLASQRPQKVHNDTLTSCETLLAMRVIHAADRGAIQVWIEGCGDKAIGKQVLDTVAGNARGEAWAWSPEIGFGPERVKFPMFETFDSFAPPQLQKKLALADWSTVNLDDVKVKLATVIEEAKANDPKELQRKLREAEQKLRKLEQSPAVQTVTEKTIEVPVLTKECRALIEEVITVCGEAMRETAKKADSLQLLYNSIVTQLRPLSQQTAKVALPRADRFYRTAPAPRPAPAHRQHDRSEGYESNGDAKISRTQQRILDAIAWFESIGTLNPSTLQVGAIALIDATGGHFSNTVGPLSSAGLVNRGAGTISLTDAGRQHANIPDNLTTLDEYHEMLRQRVRRCNSAGGKTVEILDCIINHGGHDVDVETIGQQVGIDHTGGHFSNMIGPLGTLGLVTRNKGIVSPTEILFPSALK